MNPNYKGQDLSTMSANEKEAAQKKINEDIINLSKDNNITLGKLNEAFTSPLYYRDWKPADESYNTTTTYDWEHPIYGGAHDVVGGNTEGRYEPRNWTKDGKIVVGDKTYKNMKDYETSDEYLLPRYELAKSAAAKDDAGKELWNNYIGGLNPNYAASYDPSIVFGKDYTNYLQDYDTFKNYINTNYNTLNTGDTRSGFFDQIPGQMHGTIPQKVSEARELYQMSDNPGVYLTPEGNWQNYYSDAITNETDEVGRTTKLHTLSPKAIAFTSSSLPDNIEIAEDGTYTEVKDPKKKKENDHFPTPTNWPLAVAAGLQIPSLVQGLLPADHSNSDALINASKDAGNFRPVQFKPIGNYLTYNPLDIWYGQNRLNAIARAADRTILNSSLPEATKYAMLLAANQSDQLAQGNLFRQGQEYDDALRKTTGEFNKDTDKFNSEGFLKADMANQDADVKARGYQFELLNKGLTMREREDAERAANLKGALTGLGNLAYTYGQNKWNQDVMGWKLRHNQYPISQLEGDKYALDSGWEVKDGYLVKKSKGGKLKRKHRGLGF